MHGETGLVGDLADNLDVDASSVGDAVGVVGAIGESLCDERVARAGPFQQRHRTIAVLHIGWVNEQAERPAIGVDHRVTLAPEDLLGGIEAARAAAFRGFH
jgi:hypothetical protein